MCYVRLIKHLRWGYRVFLHHRFLLESQGHPLRQDSNLPVLQPERFNAIAQPNDILLKFEHLWRLILKYSFEQPISTV